MCACVACFALGTQQAYATYADYDTENPSEQDLGTIGDVIYASEVPNGVYEVVARTSSNMCILYPTAEDAASRENNREKCLIAVEDGSMTAVFYISSMYNRLCLGKTAEEAAALTNADGTDDSAYLRGDPADGYVPHLFTMQIPGLNYPMNFAAFAGGNYPYDPSPTSGWSTRAKWYRRTVVFKPTDEILRAIAAAKSGDNGNEGEGDNGNEGENGNDGGNEGENGGNEGENGNGNEGENGGNEGENGGNENGSGNEGENGNGAENGNGDGTGNGNGDGNGNAGNKSNKNEGEGSGGDKNSGDKGSSSGSKDSSESSDPSSPESEAKSEEPVPEPSAITQESAQAGKPLIRRGTLLTPATLELEVPKTQQANNEMPEMIELGPTGLSPVQIAALVIGGLVCAGVALRFLMFNASRRPAPRGTRDDKRE